MPCPPCFPLSLPPFFFDYLFYCYLTVVDWIMQQTNINSCPLCSDGSICRPTDTEGPSGTWCRPFLGSAQPLNPNPVAATHMLLNSYHRILKKDWKRIVFDWRIEESLPNRVRLSIQVLLGGEYAVIIDCVIWYSDVRTNITKYYRPKPWWSYWCRLILWLFLDCVLTL